MKARGVRLQYSFDATEECGKERADQRGAALHNPLFDLLQAVHQQGSIQHAAKALGASYRHVWGALKRWEATLGEPLVSWTQGQPARLTPFADRLLWAETRARARLAPHIEALRAELERVLDEAIDGSQHVLTVFASHDLALPLLRELASAQQRLHVGLHFTGSVDALQALAQGRCQVAGFHVPLPTGKSTPALFARAMKPLLEPGRHKLIGCARRRQGLIVARGNPLAIGGLADLARLGDSPGAGFINRQSGSGTRLLMDQLLADAGLRPEAIAGWQAPPESSHVAVAAAVAGGMAAVGPGIEAAARQFDLGFVPLVDENYFLVCLKDVLALPAVAALRRVLASPLWQQALASLPGYAPSRSGEVLSLTEALPWWRWRAPRRADRPPSGKVG